MTRLEKINQFRSDNGLTTLAKLPDLSTHCESCGTRFSKTAINGGRCECCGTSICSVTESQIRAWENEK